MFPAIASFVDFLHALLMVAWVAGIPLLFQRRHPRATRWYAIYAIVFVVLYQASRLVLGECFLTTLSRFIWEHGGTPRSAPGEWLTVRIATAVFHLAPSHKAITVMGQGLVVVTAVGMLMALRRGREAVRGV